MAAFRRDGVRAGNFYGQFHSKKTDVARPSIQRVSPLPAALFVIPWLAISVWASVGGSITTVTDISGAVIPKATVTATHAENGIRQTTTTDRMGFYSFNTVNHAPFLGPQAVDGNIDSSTFGQVINVAAPRLVQVGAKFLF